MKCALVTGGSRGIGRAVCVRLARMGYHVIVNYVSNDAEARKTMELIAEAGSTGELLKFDVGDNAAAVSAIEGWQDAHPDTYIEVLVNNAGVRKDNLMLWMEQEDWTKVILTSLDAFYNVTRPVLKPMLVRMQLFCGNWRPDSSHQGSGPGGRTQGRDSECRGSRFCQD